MMSPIAAFFLIVSWVAPAHATPFFAVSEGASCVACHVNPSGGGMRNDYGRYVYGTTKLPIHPGGFRAGAPLDANISETFQVGGDLRVAFVKQRPADPEGATLDSFAAMQADMYFAAKPVAGLTAYVDTGVYNSFEAMGMYDFGRWKFLSGYLKVGRFMPAFGVRVPNHHVFTREDIGLGPQEKDIGAEAGLYLGQLHLQGGVFNGAGSASMFDDNPEKAIVARAEILLHPGPVGLMLGASSYENTSGLRTEQGDFVISTRTFQKKKSLHGGLSLGRLTWLGEGDLTDTALDNDNTTGTAEHVWRSYQELQIGVVRGIKVLGTYEYREPDLDVRSGVATRVGGGFEVHPVPGAEIFALYRRVQGLGPVESSNDGADELVAMAHLYF